MAQIADTTITRGARPAVKFCGLSHLADVEAINELSPEYVGFVFWPKSKRLVDASQAQTLRKALDGSIRTVGVFVDADAAEVATLFEQGIISVAQLHGSESDDYIADLRNRTDNSIEIWKAFEVCGDSDIDRANASSADLVLLDGGKGEGNAFPWEMLGGMRRPYALAGGLTPENISEALSLASPVVVDVSSGIEERPEGDGEGCVPRADSAANGNVQWTFPPSEDLPEHGAPPSPSPRKSPVAMAAFIQHVRG